MPETPAGQARSWSELILAIAVLALVVGPVGAAVFVLGFIQGDSPCILCWAQRTGMVLVAVTGLFIARYGPRPRYIGLAMLIAAWGVYMGIRHSSLHLARDIGQGFSLSILGAHTYTWSFFIFWTTLVLVGVLVATLPDGAPRRVLRELRPIERTTGWLLFVVVAANAVQAFASTGPPPFIGQSDPVRFSFNPAHWVWSLDEWTSGPIGWRGRFAVPRPQFATFDTEPAAGPLTGVRPVPMRTLSPLMMSGSGPLTDMAYDATTDRFVVSGDRAITLMSGTLDRVLRRVTIDPGFSVDLSHLAGVTFLDSHTVMALSESKSYVVVRENDTVDQNATFPFFFDNSGRFEEIARGRFATTRARMNYVLSLAFDPGHAALYAVAVTTSGSQSLVITRFDKDDMMVAEEFVPKLDPGSGLAVKRERSLGEYVVTSAAIRDGRLYAMSAAYSTVLVIDPGSHTIVGAHALTGITRPVGIAFKASTLFAIDERGNAWAGELP
jgi:disulfide bond formation protein DsbB